jgi:hypothetical protein
MKILAATLMVVAGLLFVPRTFGSAPLYLAQSGSYDVSNQTGDDTSNEIAPPEVNDTGS